ncbi:MAG: ferritin-like domain-containing protein [Clostridia bacterium]|nr:ferritin-like domain-containing protein [Clostridia bacterium]
MPEAGPGLCGCDREVFNRVWRRVMPEDTYGSPVQLIGEEETPVRGERLYGTGGGGPDLWRPEPPIHNPVPPVAPAPPPTPPIACLGPGSAVYGAELQSFIAHELQDCRCYMALARRSSGNVRQTLMGLAQDEKRHAKRLSTAYFLISGVEYWPDQPGGMVNTTGPLPACLRARFAEEQKGEAAYHAAAERTCDPCLKELYLELANDENAHSWVLRGLLEKM